MSDLKIGDLAVISKRRICCGDEPHIGIVFTVEAIWHNVKISGCKVCGSHVFETSFVWSEGRRWCVELYRVKRIPPLSELESEQNKEEIPA